MKLSKRLGAIENLIAKNERVIDVACDHGLLGINLLLSNKTNDVLLTDNSEKALSGAIKNAKKYNVSPLFKVTDGLTDIVLSDYDTIIIAGLGSEQIINIIKNHNLKHKLILTTHSNPYQLRSYMQKNNYKLITEVLVHENNKYYFVMEYKQGKDNYNFKQLFFSPIYLGKYDELYTSYLKHLLKKYMIIYQKIPLKYIIRKLYYRYVITVIKKALR